MIALETIYDQTKRSIWSLGNVINCITEDMWNKEYCQMPLWKHIYHTIHSLDRWYINPFRYTEPEFHVEGLNDLDMITEKELSRNDIIIYFETVSEKVLSYILSLEADELMQYPKHSPYTRFHLILAQHRHLDMHIGMIMGFIIAEKGKWPRVMGLNSDFSEGGSLFF